MTKLLVFALAATILTGGLQTAAIARPNDGSGIQNQRAREYTEPARHFWDQMQRNGN